VAQLLRPRNQQIARFEDRVLLAINPMGPKLVAVIPNAGDILEENQVEVLSIAPRELLLRFAEGQQIDPDAANLSQIQVMRAGADGQLGTTDDVAIAIGWAGRNDAVGAANEVTVRFASTLPDDLYRLTVGTSFKNLQGETYDDSDTSGVDTQTLTFRLDLGAQVTAVVPQPVERGAVYAKMIAPGAITSGSMFRVFDGTNTKIFEFGAGSPGTVPVDLTSAVDASDVAEAVRAAIQSEITLGHLQNMTVALDAANPDTIVLTGSRVRLYRDTLPFEVWDLAQKRNVIEVYFNNDKLETWQGHPGELNPEVFQRIMTQGSLRPR